METVVGKYYAIVSANKHTILCVQNFLKCSPLNRIPLYLLRKVAFLSPLCGIVLGYITALLPVLKLDHKRRKTIAIETGIQNCQISQSILVISYAAKPDIFEQIRLYPLLNSFTQLLYGLVIVLTMSQAHRVTCCKKTKNISTDDNQDDNEIEEKYELT